jgi:hypothetical protein
MEHVLQTSLFTVEKIIAYKIISLHKFCIIELVKLTLSKISYYGGGGMKSKYNIGECLRSPNKAIQIVEFSK